MTGVPGMAASDAFESLRYLVESGVAYEVPRDHYHEALLPTDKLQRLLDLLREAGAGQIMLQHCRMGNILDSTRGERPALVHVARQTNGRWPGAAVGLKGRAHVGQVALGSHLRQPHQRFPGAGFSSMPNIRWR